MHDRPWALEEVVSRVFALLHVRSSSPALKARTEIGVRVMG